MGAGAVLAQSSPVTAAYVQAVNDRFRQNGIGEGYAGLDSRGRIELLGQFEDNRQVDLAFSLAQTVVGVRWVSPVTPERIKVKEWEVKLSGLFSRKGGDPQVPGATDAPPGLIRRKYALVVGIGKFMNPKITPLQFAARDAQVFRDYLIDPKQGNFPPQNVQMLLDEQATRANIKQALDLIRSTAQEDDLVTLFFSSHGTPPDKFGGVHVVTYDTQVEPRHAVWSTSLSEDIVKDFVQNVKAKRLTVIMDTCFSNGAYKQIPGFLPPGGKSLMGSDEEGYGLSGQYMSKRLLGAKDIFVEEERPKKPAPGASRAKGMAPEPEWGKVLISASDAGERSWESDSLRNAYFTRYFIIGLQRSQGRVKDSFAYAKPIVRTSVKREKGEDIEQNPQMVTDRRNCNYALSAPGTGR